jgi:hypothetical protein
MGLIVHAHKERWNSGSSRDEAGMVSIGHDISAIFSKLSV